MLELAFVDFITIGDRQINIELLSYGDVIVLSFIFSSETIDRIRDLGVKDVIFLSLATIHLSTSKID